VDDLQPLLDVLLHAQRSEYRADVVFVEHGVAAREQQLVNLLKLRIRDPRLGEKQLTNALVPVMNALVVASMREGVIALVSK